MVGNERHTLLISSARIANSPRTAYSKATIRGLTVCTVITFFGSFCTIVCNEFPSKSHVKWVNTLHTRWCLGKAPEALSDKPGSGQGVGGSSIFVQRVNKNRHYGVVQEFQKRKELRNNWSFQAVSWTCAIAIASMLKRKRNDINLRPRRDLHKTYHIHKRFMHPRWIHNRKYKKNSRGMPSSIYFPLNVKVQADSTPHRLDQPKWTS